MNNKKLLTLVLFSAFLLSLSSCNQAKEKTLAQLKREKLANFIKNSPYTKTKYLAKETRLAAGLPPNPYQEEQWELTMNPELGRPTPEKINTLMKRLNDERATMRVPGDGSDNPWVERGPNNVGGRVKALMFDPNDSSMKTVFAGGITGGLWKNTDIGNSNSAWTLVNFPANVEVSSITYDPLHTQTFYIGTGESYTGDGIGNGVWKSTDGGTSWTHVFGGIEGSSTYTTNVSLTVNSPASIAGSYYSHNNAFDPPLTFTTVTGNVVLADDGTAAGSEACNPLVNGAAINGNIAFVKRGNCNFIDKVLNAQNAGATAILIYNNVNTGLVNMSGSSAGLTIPSMFISKDDGEAILASLNAGDTVNITANFDDSGVTNVALVHGKVFINDVLVRNVGSTTELYAAVGDASFAAASIGTVMGSSYQGIYKSTDQGATWTQLALPNDSSGIQYTPIDLELGADNAIWLSTTYSVYSGSEGAGKIFKSTDGANFTLKNTILNGKRVELACSKSNANKIYALVYVSNTDAPLASPVEIYKSTDGFSTFSTLSKPTADGGLPANDFTNGQAFYDLAIEVDPNNDEKVYVGGIDWHKSVNGGTSWSQISHYYGFGSPRLHPDQHGIAFGDSNHILFGNDGGVGFSSTGGSSINHYNKNLNITQFYSVGVAPTTAMSGEYFAAGAQDNGTQFFENASAGINNSTQAQTGDGATTLFDQDGTDKYFISNYIYNAKIQLTNLTDNSTRSINTESYSAANGNGAFINVEALDSNQNALFTDYSTHATATTPANYRLAMFTNLLSGTVQKTIIDNNELTSEPTALKVSPFNTSSSTLFIGTKEGKLIKVTDPTGFFASWNNISGADFVGSISDIEFGDSEQKIFVTMYNYGVNNVWYSADGGTTWAQKDGNLPDLPVRCILQNPLNTEQVVIGTQLGIWWTQNFSDANPVWRQGFNGMRNVRVNDLQMRNDYKIYAATFGRGIFSGQFTAADNTASIDEVSQNSIMIYPTVSDGAINIKSNTYTSNATMQVYDMLGKLVYNSKIDLAHEVSKTLHVNAGTYLVKLTGDGLSETHKIIIK